MDYADLELGIHQYKESEYQVDFRLNVGNSDADIRTASGRPVGVTFDFEALQNLDLLPEKYGEALKDMLFADPTLRTAFVKARSLAAISSKLMRLRLFIGPTASPLHTLRWETLIDPETLRPLATDEKVIFSRYLTSPDERMVNPKPKGSLRGFVAVASPNDDENLPIINYRDQINVANAGLAGVQLTCLPELGPDDKPIRRATMENLLSALRAEENIDIFYLVCHGRLNKKGQPCVYLETETGGADWDNAPELVKRLQQLPQLPRLVVLVSCQSAGDGAAAPDNAETSTGYALAALGPRLADIGVPAVVAMHGNFSFESAGLFLPKFLNELQQDGQIDRALAVARGTISKRYDSFMPVLFMRLRSGRLWYQPGFTDKSKASQKFPAICQNLNRRKVTPIVGPVLLEPLLGSLREIARRWAKEYNYPMSPHERQSLPQVAQFLAINQQSVFPFNDLEDSLKRHIIKSRPGVPGLENFLTLNEMLDKVTDSTWQPSGMEPHQVLARMNLPIFITANQDQLLEKALRAQNKTPRTILCPWNEYIIQPDNLNLETLKGTSLDPMSPIVFHLFGIWDQPDSVVLTEDQYFSYLLRISAIKDFIPEQIRLALADSGLFFLGFQIEEWSFRVIFHSLLSMANGNRRGRYAQLAAQLEPDDERMLEPALARQYLEKYYEGGGQIDIYWGRPEEFISELDAEMRKQGGKL